MVGWVESQSILVIAAIVFLACYALAALIFAGAVALSRRPMALALRATSPAMLTPLSVIAGLLIAFLAARVWANVDRANALVAQEASAVREIGVLGEAMPSATRASLGVAVRAYLHFVESEDFPAMAANRANPAPAPALVEALRAVLDFAPVGAGQQIVQERALTAIESAMEARRSRIGLSRAAIAPVQWLVVIVLATLIMVVIATLHLERRTTVAMNLLLFSTAIAACLVLLMVHDRPFATGGYTVQPRALLEIGGS